MSAAKDQKIAAAIHQALQDEDEGPGGHTAFLNVMEEFADTLADILGANSRTFNRRAFLAKCGFPARRS